MFFFLPPPFHLIMVSRFSYKKFKYPIVFLDFLNFLDYIRLDRKKNDGIIIGINFILLAER